MIIIIISIARNMKLATFLLYRLRIILSNSELVDAMLNATGRAGCIREAEKQEVSKESREAWMQGN